MRRISVLSILALMGGLFTIGGGSASATPLCTDVDGVIGPEWAGVTPTFVPYSGPGNGSLVAYNVYVRTDANCVYVGAEAQPASGDRWDDAYDLDLGDSANVYFQTDFLDGSDLIVEPKFDPPQYCNADESACNSSNVGLAGPSVYTAGDPGRRNDDIAGVKGGVREVAIPWSVLHTDPDGLGFPVAGCNVQVRTIQAFGYEFETGDPVERFGSVTDPACPSTCRIHGDGSIGGKTHFVLDVRKRASGALSGHAEYRDDGVVNARSMSLDSVSCSSGHAVIMGSARVMGPPKSTQTFKIEVTDNAPDTFAITLSGGYSNSGPLTKGHLEVRT